MFDELSEAIAGEKAPDYKRLHDEWYNEVRTSADELDKFAIKVKDFLTNKHYFMNKSLQEVLEAAGLPRTFLQRVLETHFKEEKSHSEFLSNLEVALLELAYPEERLREDEKKEIKDLYLQKFDEYAKDSIGWASELEQDLVPKFLKEKVIHDLQEKFNLNPKIIRQVVDEESFRNLKKRRRSKESA